MNSKEIVKRAVEMNGPERIPINIVGKDESDIKFIMYKPARNFDSKVIGFQNGDTYGKGLIKHWDSQKIFLLKTGPCLKTTARQARLQKGVLKDSRNL